MFAGGFLIRRHIIEFIYTDSVEVKEEKARCQGVSLMIVDLHGFLIFIVDTDLSSNKMIR